MADTPISGLPVAGVANAADEYAANQAGTTRKVTAAQLDTLIITGHEHTGAAGDGASLGPDSIDNRTRKGWVPAHAMYSWGGYAGALSGAAYCSVASALCANGNLEGPDGTWLVPADYDSGNVTIKMYWFANCAAGLFADVELKTTARADTEDLTIAAEINTGYVQYANAGANLLNVDTMASNIPVTAGDVLIFNLTRDAQPANADDTLEINMYILGVELLYTADS